MPETIALKINGLNKSFGDVKAVVDLNLEITRGELFGFLGPNGAGKTTSINLICGFLKPDSGNVLMYGDQKGEFTHIDRRQVGICPQEITLWNKLTCFEQLVHIGNMYDLSFSKARNQASILLKKVDIYEKRNKLASTLSGGLKRRLNIIMALVHEPELVIFDEPEAGIDPQSRVMVRQFIHSLRGSKTIIVTTHNMDEADRICDRVAIIDRGKLLLTDTPENLKHTIGEGDIIEISTPGNIIPPAQKLTDDLRTLTNNIFWSDGWVTFKGQNLVSRISVFIDFLKKHGIKTGEIKIRENTLEDVFISLTGRTLRE